jgi:hypothetical protein
VNESLKMSCNPLKIVVPIWTYVKEIQQNYFESNLLVLQQHVRLTYFCNTEARSRDSCCHGGVKYHEHLSVALVIRHESACAVLYCHLWPVWLCLIIPHCLINGTIFEKRNIEHKICVSLFSPAFFWNFSHSVKNSRYYHKCAWVFLWSTCYSCQNLTKLEFSRQIFEKSRSIRFNKNPSIESHVVSCGQTDMTELNSLFFFQFCERSEQPIFWREYFSVFYLNTAVTCSVYVWKKCITLTSRRGKGHVYLPEKGRQYSCIVCGRFWFQISFCRPTFFFWCLCHGFLQS